MKYSNYIGVMLSILLMVTCFIPWVYIASIDTIVSGFHSDKTNFGKPGLMNIILAVCAIVFFMLSTTWAKRLNLFVCTFNLAWSARNYLLITQCELGECPEKRWGMYLLILLSLAMLIIALFPKINLKDGNR